MLVMYQSSRLLWYMVGKWLVRIKHLCLVNILAGKELVPEYMPYFSSIEPIAQDCIDLLEDQDILDYMSNHLVKISLPMAQIHSSKRVADITMDMLAG